jgi:hypothetical protein
MAFSTTPTTLLRELDRGLALLCDINITGRNIHTSPEVKDWDPLYRHFAVVEITDAYRSLRTDDIAGICISHAKLWDMAKAIAYHYQQQLPASKSRKIALEDHLVVTVKVSYATTANIDISTSPTNAHVYSYKNKAELDRSLQRSQEASEALRISNRIVGGLYVELNFGGVKPFPDSCPDVVLGGPNERHQSYQLPTSLMMHHKQMPYFPAYNPFAFARAVATGDADECEIPVDNDDLYIP